jgi:HD-GYP domain-containing protein (c-di-GMP phosphodiesterase class II)
MAVDYKKELESASKTMILIHDPNVLIKIVVRMIVQKVRIKYAGILLHQRDRDSYILTVSRGRLGIRIPEGFARMDTDNPLIRFFREHKDKELFHDGALVYKKAKKILSKKNIHSHLKQLLRGAVYQMEIFDAVACIPSYFRDDLLGLLLMGKKNNGREFSRSELDFFAALASDVAMAIRNAQLFKELEQELTKTHELFVHTTMALAAAVDAKDHYTRGHIGRVTDISLKIAGEFGKINKKAQDEQFLESLYIASLLHDIGKIGISEAILNKEGPLTPEERKIIQDHAIIGVKILEPIKELGEAILGVKYHHEWYDGSGYPEGLKGEQIPLIASIIAVADAFDAMTIDRPYRRARTTEEAIQEIKKQSGKQFDSQIACVLVNLYQEGKI